MNYLLPSSAPSTPALIAAAGERASYRFLEFFTAQIRNSHTRKAYMRGVGGFCAWLADRGVPSIAAVSSVHVAAYVEELGRMVSGADRRAALGGHPHDVRLAGLRRGVAVQSGLGGARSEALGEEGQDAGPVADRGPAVPGRQ